MIQVGNGLGVGDQADREPVVCLLHDRQADPVDRHAPLANDLTPQLFRELKGQFNCVFVNLPFDDRSRLVDVAGDDVALQPVADL